MSEVNVTVGTLCEVTANYDGITLAVTATVCPAGSVQLQADWNQADDTAVDFIKNKPTIDDTVTEASQNAVKSSGIWTWVKGLFTPKDPTETESDTLTDESVFQFWKGELKKITWANIKDTLKAYFDTIYSTFSGSYNDLSDKPTIPSNAAQITVSEPVTPDFTPVVQGDNLQQVTNKVAGLQLNTLLTIETDAEVSSIEITNINVKEIICIFSTTGYKLSGSPANNRLRFQINNITSGYFWGPISSFSYIRTLASNSAIEHGYLKLNVTDLIVSGLSVNKDTSFSIGLNSTVTGITSFKIFLDTATINIGSKFIVYGR